MPNLRDALASAKDTLKQADETSHAHEKKRLSSKVVEGVENANGSAETLNQASSQSQGMQMLMTGVNMLVDSLPGLVRQLDELAKIHPFVAIAVGAFKVVIELEIKRRDNDNKVNLLFLEMRDMMATLLQLQNIRRDHVGRDGKSIGERLEDLLVRTAEDIKQCANVCDTYSKKRLLVKVLKVVTWDDTLKGYITLFTNRKTEINQALIIHTGLGVNSANDKLDSLDAKMNLVLEFFRQAIPLQQRRLSTLVESKGGAQAILEKQDDLEDLLRKEEAYEPPLIFGPEVGREPPSYRSSSYSGSHRHRSSSSSKPFNAYSRSSETAYQRRRTSSNSAPSTMPRSYSYAQDTQGSMRRTSSSGYYQSGPMTLPAMGQSYGGTMIQPPMSQPYGATAMAPPDMSIEVELLKQELLDTPTIAIQKNFEVFERKFKMQQKELVEEMRRLVTREGDRVISSVLGGPHERIVDQVLYDIWGDMRWRGIVKARHLVLAIHDFYTQQLANIGIQDDSKFSIRDEDVWTLEYIDLFHLQSITEALDIDASGFITVAEVNDFTICRPTGWSLLHWLAYWAIGWQTVVTSYRRKVYGLVKKIESAEFAVLFGNRRDVSQYIAEIRSLIPDMGSGFREAPVNDFILERFSTYTQAEERRLADSLNTAKFDIDGLDTVALIVGPKGIERSLFQLLYLLLQRHLAIIEVAKTHLLHPEELENAVNSLRTVSTAWMYRSNELSALFSSRRLNAGQEFESYACGIFDTPSGRALPTSDDNGGEDEEQLQPSQRHWSEVLKYPPQYEGFYQDDPSPQTNDNQSVGEGPLKMILGPWCEQVCYPLTEAENNAGAEVEYVTKVVYTLSFHASPNNPQQVVSYSRYDRPRIATEVIVTGECTHDADGRLFYAFTKTFNSSMLRTEYYRLYANDDSTVLRGESCLAPDFSSNVREVVVMKRIPAELFVFQPTPTGLAKNKIRALWRFALDAALHQARQHLFSWSMIKERKERKRQFATLYYHTAYIGLSLYPQLGTVMSVSTPHDLHCWSYMASDPVKYPWISPSCIVCSSIPTSETPLIRCLTCMPLPPAMNGGICNARECLQSHLDNPYPLTQPYYGGSSHTTVRVPNAEWRLPVDPDAPPFTVKSAPYWKNDADELENGSRRSDSGPGTPTRLSTILEGSEDEEDSTEGSAKLVSPSISTTEDTRKSLSGFLYTADRAVTANAPPVLVPGTAYGDGYYRRRGRGESEARGRKEDDGPPCLRCESVVKRPCWFCIDCPGEDVYMCLDCGFENVAEDVGTHTPAHALVHVSAPPRSRSLSPLPTPLPGGRARFSLPGEESTEGLSTVQDRMTALEGRFGAVEDRLSRMENLLESALFLLQGGRGSQAQIADSSSDDSGVMSLLLL